ncbi:MAG TPA: LCP family protein [Erysipelotrichaceae bacterium]|nr:LCP family protein [Erysipelotrichaceae bacterium]
MKTIKIKSKSNEFINLILFGLFAIISILSVVNILQYLSLSYTLFILGISMLVLMNALVFILTRLFSRHKVLEMIMTGVLVVLIGLSSYALITILRINNAVGNVVVEDDVVEEVFTSFVTYDNTSITSIDDISGKRFGIVDNENVLEGNSLAIEELENANIDVTFVKYDTYNNMLLALFSNEIDVAPLPQEYYSMFITNDGYEEYLDKTEVIHEFSKKVKIESQDTVRKDLSQEPFSVLLMGNDGGRTDALIYATFNPKTMVVTLTSIARDSYVPIACYNEQAKDKINHSRQISRQCTLDTVSNLLDEKVDYFVEVNFEAVVDVVDTLDKIWIDSPVEFVGQDASSDRGHYTVWIGKGGQYMSGEQVLAFARERKNMPGGDLQRQLNQQQVIRSLMNKLLETRDINLFISAVEAAGNNVKTNLPISQLTGLANYVIGEMNTNPLDNSYFVQMKNSRITGYFSWAYNDSLQLPLSIYKPYNGSISDAQALINSNLMDDNYVPALHKSFTFNIFTPYFGESYIKEFYDEPEIHEPLPDFMPSMISDSKPWIISEVKAWQQNRNWINLEIVEIWEDNPKYNASYLYNQVISQSVKYGVKTTNIRNLRVEIIKRDLDCRVVENRSDAQCSSIVPNFVGMTYREVSEWNNANGNIVSINLIDETSTSYDLAQVNKAITQSVEAYTKLKNVSGKIDVSIIDYPKLTLPVTRLFSEKWKKADVEAWYSTNAAKIFADPLFTEAYHQTIPAGEILEVMYIQDGVATKYQSDTVIKGNMQIVFSVSIGPDPAIKPVTPSTPTTTP